MGVRLALVLLLVSCRGEAVEATTDARPTDAAACNVAGNYVLNPSFEIATDTAIASWPSALQPKLGSAADCDRYAEWRTTKAWDSVRQDIPLTEELPEKTVIEASVFVKTLDGNAEPMRLWIEGERDDWGDTVTAALDPSGWRRLSSVHVLQKPTRRLSIALLTGIDKPRALAFDLVTLVRK